MSQYPINNAHTPLKGIDGSLVNIDSSSVGGIPFTNTKIPYGLHTLPAAGSNIQGAASIYPASQKGGKINRRKINKISRKYIMLKQCGGGKAKMGSKSKPYSSKRKAMRSRRRVCYYKKKGRTLKMKKKKKGKK